MIIMADKLTFKSSINITLTSLLVSLSGMWLFGLLYTVLILF